ncbi:MAG TPA: hypothetical protein VEM58_08925 [Streptosporangiaceae bacterium]|nr:hypothetical protein [Streptosporangiaceae bacterium]
MTDMERRLRAALRAATEPAPPGLLDAVLRRHRRHRMRVGASLVAVLAVAVLAVSSLTGGLHGGLHDGTRGGVGSPVLSSPSRPARQPVAAPGTVLSGCGGGANAGALGRHWKSFPLTRVGPLLFLNGGRRDGAVRRNTISLYVAIAVLDKVTPGSVVVVRVAPGWRRDLRFLYGPRDSLNPGTRYTMRSGESGVTFVACRPDQEFFPSHKITDYYGGFLVRGPRCVPVHVRVPGRARRLTVHLGACPGR